MTELFGIPLPILLGQLLVGLINGAFYATLSLGLAIIFGLLRIINFAHGVQYMLGAFVSWMLLNYLGIGYGWSLIIAPLIVGVSGLVLERVLLRRIHGLDHIYGLLLTFGVALIVQGIFRNFYGASGQAYAIPSWLSGGFNIGVMYLPAYRVWVIAISAIVCIGTWFAIEKTRLGSYLRGANENPEILESFGINVPLLLTLTYGVGVGLAAFAGVLAAPIYSVNPNMGDNLLIIAFAVVVIGGMGSIGGAIVTGFAMGVVEGLTKAFYPEFSEAVIFLVMILVLMVKPTGVFGRAESLIEQISAPHETVRVSRQPRFLHGWIFLGLIVLLIAAPFFLYPIFVMKLLCFGLFACAFNLLLGHSGLLSFGHAAFYGIASFLFAHSAKVWGLSPEGALIVGTLSAALLGLVFGWLAIKRRGIYFAMATLALSQLIYFLAVRMPFTGGEDGIQSVPRGVLLGIFDLNDDSTLYVLVAVIFLASIFAIYRLINSPLGQVLQAIKDNEARAVSLGYKVTRYQLFAFVASATFAGLAGALNALVFQLASLADVHWSLSGEVILMTLLGGMGTFFGPLIGAIVVLGMENYLLFLGEWVTVIQGLVFVICVLVFRSGLLGTLAQQIKMKL
ncbi:branched-chain amino acid ABC transporter permease [Marinobacter sp. F3R11]|nr:branched-chain amino acid ABC transporter permease [Marinobacter sp. F3R11]